MFQRLQRIYQSNNVVSALVAGLSLAVITFPEFHPTQSDAARAAEGLLCSSAVTAVVAIMLSITLLFRFEGVEKASRSELALAWLPLVLMDFAIVEFLLGLVLWYVGKNNSWRNALMGSQLAFLLLVSVWVSFWMWKTMSDKGGLGREEAEVIEVRVADE